MSDVPNVGIGAALGDAGAAPVVVLDGKTWTIGYPTQKAKSQLEMLVVQVAQQNVKDLKPAMEQAAWDALKAEVDTLLLGRQWQTWGQLWGTITNGPDGFPLFLMSLAKPHHPEMTLADACRLWLEANAACRLALMMVVPDFFTQLSAFLPADDESKAREAARMQAASMKALAPPTLSD